MVRFDSNISELQTYPNSHPPPWLGPHKWVRIWVGLFLFGIVRVLLGPDPPDPQICLALPSSGVDLASIRHWFDIWPYFDPRGGEGEADSRVGSGGPVPKKPRASLELIDEGVGMWICACLFWFSWGLSCTRLRVPPVALHVSQLISWIYSVLQV